MIKGNHYHLFERDGEPVGTVKFHFSKVKDDHIDLGVYASCYTTTDVFPSIVELVGHYATNATTIRWYCGPQEPVRYYMDDIQNWDSVNWSGMMMRVIDFEKYCESIKIPEHATDSVVLKLSDEMAPWNTGTYRLNPDGISLEVERLDDSVEPDVSVDALRLSELIGGLYPATVLRGLGKIACSEDIAMNLDSIFPEDTFVSYQRF